MATKNSAKRLVKTPDGAERAGEWGRHSLVLQAWEAINSERERRLFHLNARAL
jgi:hypothetical protein